VPVARGAPRRPRCRRRRRPARGVRSPPRLEARAADASAVTGPDREAGAPLIEIRAATVYRGETRVLDRFSLDIAQGEQVAILGPNGAGKTTLLKLVSRELYPAAAPGACVRILGRERWNVWELRSKIGIVSHDLQAR